MIKIVITGKSWPRAKSSAFPYRIEVSAAADPIYGLSRQPLLDACRTLKSMGVDTAAEVRLYPCGSEDWSLQTTVGSGARLVVRDDEKRGPVFERYKPRDLSP